MTSRTPTSRIVRCPTCAKEVVWSPENVWRPFCSERCRRIDLGAWAAEEYRVAAEKADADEPGDGASSCM